MLQKFAKALVAIIGAFLLFYSLLFIVWDASKTANLTKSGVRESEFSDIDEYSWAISKVDSSDFVGPVYPASGDTILAINDSLSTFDQIDRWLETVREPEERDAVRFVHNGREKTAVLRFNHYPGSFKVQLVTLQAVKFIIILSLIGVGLWAYIKRSNSKGVRALALYCFSLASFLLSTGMIHDRYAVFDLPYQDITRNILIFFTVSIGGIWLNLNVLFPRVSRFIKRWKGYGYLLIYSPQMFYIVTLFFDNAPQQAIIPLILIQLVIGLFILWRNYRSSRSTLEKRQTKLVLYGTVIGFISLLIIILSATLLSGLYNGLDRTIKLLILNACFLMLLLTPLSFAYAFGKYKLLEVEGKLRRGTRHFVMTASLIFAFFIITYLMSEFLIRNIGITNRTPILLVAILMALGINPIQRYLQGIFERKFYPGRYQLRVMMEDFIQRTGSFPDRETLFNQFEKRMHEAIGVRKVVTVLRNTDGSFVTPNGKKVPFNDQSDLIEHLEKTEFPTLLDEAMAGLRIPFTDRQMAWIQNNQVIVVIPMFARLRLIGFLALGSTVRGGDYTPEIIEILNAITRQIALASENLRLLEENLEKRRLEEQLSIARDIQHGLLPQSIPDTPGLDVAANCRFSLEVAGDYYDVIALRDGKTVFAVGDVSGKGAGAALIMASLQASLRTAVKAGIDLRKLVSEVNDLIWQNTPIEQYITFFVGMFDPNDYSLTYVNAGHNPPMLLGKKSGTITELNDGGLILGMMPGVEYVNGKVILEPHDRLILFTDGVSEAMNSTDEEFGEHRIGQLMQKSQSESCKEAVKLIEREVIKFHGSNTFDDDFTLLIASTTDFVSKETEKAMKAQA